MLGVGSMRALVLGDRIDFAHDGKRKRGIVKGNAVYYVDKRGRYYSVFVPEDLSTTQNAGYYTVYERDILGGRK